MIDFGSVLKIKKNWSTFCGNHPRVEEFIGNIGNKGFCEGQEIAVAVRYPDGTEFKTGIRLQESDLEFLELLRSLT